MAQRDMLAGFERRREDYPLITGQASYVDDVRLSSDRPPVLHMAVVRSPYAHARLIALELEQASAREGVVAVYSSKELSQDLLPLKPVSRPGMADLKQPQRHLLAVEKVRYIGEPVAIVLAETNYAAIDARDLVESEYDPLPAVIDPEQALAPDAPLLYEDLESNRLYQTLIQGGDIQAAFAQAEHRVNLRLENQRLAPSSLEPRGSLFDFDATTNQFTAYVSSQSVFQMRNVLASFLKMDPQHIRVHNADVGGAFGAKTVFLGEELIAALLAKKLARPVKWIEDRSENLQAHIHGRGQINYIEAAATAEGRLLGLKVRILGDIGAFIFGFGAFQPISSANMLSGAYRIEAIECEVSAVFTNKAPAGAYRGAGRPEAAYIVERTIERIARELNLDPVEVRRRNLIPADAFPYQTPTGLTYDSGNYQLALEKALEIVDYAGWRERQRQQREQKTEKLLGIGVSTFIETTGGAMSRDGLQEAATVRIMRDGTILVQCAVAHNGQGHFTTFAQIAAQIFEIPAARIEVQMNDTTLPGYSTGTNGSRITQVAGSAIYLAAQAVREKAFQVAARLLEVAPEDLEMRDGRILVQGVPSSSVELGTLARAVEEDASLIEQEAPNPANGVPIEGLAAWRSFAPTASAIASGAHVAIIEVESETGGIEILRYVAVDDSGRILNHYLAEAQMHGSLAQGIGQALFEGVVYDQHGQNLTATWMDYALPKAEQLPPFEVDLVETSSPLNPLGVKGIGEAGTIAAPPTIVNATLDALTPLGIQTIDMPLLPEKIWKAIHHGQAREKNPS